MLRPPELAPIPPARIAQRTERAMKFIAILSAVLLTLALAGIAGPAVATRAEAPATGTGQRQVAYGADTVCKLGCWG
jgi:hypothetical protein